LLSKESKMKKRSMLKLKKLCQRQDHPKNLQEKEFMQKGKKTETKQTSDMLMQFIVVTGAVILR